MMKLRKSTGFTLVELLIVIAIIAVLAMVGVPRFMNMIRDSRIQSCRANQGTLETALEQAISQSIALVANSQTNLIATAANPDRPLKKLISCPEDVTSTTDQDYDFATDIRAVTCNKFAATHNPAGAPAAGP